jgi:hypothetical protein
MQREERRLKVFENRRVFGPKRDGVTGEWRRLHNEELYDLYCSSNIVSVIKSRGTRWVGHVARYTGFWWGNSRERDKRLRGENNIKIYLPEVRW